VDIIISLLGFFLRFPQFYPKIRPERTPMGRPESVCFS
jgi:hypothetical protein